MSIGPSTGSGGAVQSAIAYDKHYGWGNNNGPVFNLNNFSTNFTTSYTLNGPSTGSGQALAR